MWIISSFVSCFAEHSNSTFAYWRDYHLFSFSLINCFCFNPLRVFAVRVLRRFSVPQGLCRTGTISSIRLKFRAILTMHAPWEVLPPPGTYKKCLKFDCATFLRWKTELSSFGALRRLYVSTRFVVSVSPRDRNGGARNLIGARYQGRRKLISIYIGAALILFITHAH